MKKWVFFDVMGVLLTVGDDVRDLLTPYIKNIDNKISGEEIVNEYRKASLGQISCEQFWQNVGLREDYPDIEREYLESEFTLSDNCHDVLKSLSEKYNLGIISNDVSEWSAYHRKKFDLDRYFDVVIISGDVQLRKPDAQIYRQIEKHNIEYKDCVFIDDRVKNLIPARELGFKTIYYNAESGDTPAEFYTVSSFLQLEEACGRLFS